MLDSLPLKPEWRDDSCRKIKSSAEPATTNEAFALDKSRQEMHTCIGIALDHGLLCVGHCLIVGGTGDGGIDVELIDDEVGLVPPPCRDKSSTQQRRHRCDSCITVSNSVGTSKRAGSRQLITGYVLKFYAAVY